MINVVTQKRTTIHNLMYLSLNLMLIKNEQWIQHFIFPLPEKNNDKCRLKEWITPGLARMTTCLKINC